MGDKALGFVTYYVERVSGGIILHCTIGKEDHAGRLDQLSRLPGIPCRNNC
jgi:hypothetical protein